MMRGTILCVWIAVTGLVTLQSCSEGPGTGQTGPWQKVEEITGEIRLPDIPSNTLLLTDFGGAGDSLTDNREAFDHMIARCRELGGGMMVVPPGTYQINGPVHLGSRMELHLEEGARLVFGSDPRMYLPVVLTSWEGTRCYNYSPFIYAFRASDVAITGRGVIDGEGSVSWNGWKDMQGPDQRLIRKMNNGNVPVEERVFGEGHYLRPHLIQFYECENLLVEGVKITDAPFWCLHFVYSSDITVRGVTYEALNFNNDGIDPESCDKVLIEDITFNNRDDNIAIKAGRDLEARTLGRPSRNIVVRNCRFRGLNAIAVGSEMSGGVHDVFVEECTFAGSVVYGFYLKGNRDRGGSVHHIYARDLEFDTVSAVIIIDSDYKNEGSCCPPAFSDVWVENVRAGLATEYGIYLNGSPGAHLDSVFIRNVEIGSANIPVKTGYLDYIEMDDVRINGRTFTFHGGVPEWIREADPETGREVWQVSSDTAPSVACYFECQAFTGDEEYVVFSSRSSGRWRLCRMDLETGIVRELTGPERNITDDNYTVMPDGKRVCYLDGWKLYATGVESREEELLIDFTGRLPDLPLFTGSFTNDGRYTLVFVRNDTLKAIFRADLETGEIKEVHRHREGTISHPMLNPEDPDVITYVPGPDTQNDMSLPMEQRARSWKVDLKKGTDQQFLTVPYGFRATHESWSSDGNRFYFFRKTRPGWSPAAICSMDREGGSFTVHYESDTIRLGHGSSSRDGRWFVSDSQEPGRNELLLVDLVSGTAQLLCYPNSSVDENYAFSHVHPSFSPGGNYICFTSDRTGVAQVYVVPVGDLTHPVGAVKGS